MRGLIVSSEQPHVHTLGTSRLRKPFDLHRDAWKWVSPDNIPLRFPPNPAVDFNSSGDSVGRRLIFCHAAAVDLYRGQYQQEQAWKIRITLVSTMLRRRLFKAVTDCTYSELRLG